MAILADVTLPGGVTTCRVYISPRYVSANRSLGHYCLDYLVQKGGAEYQIPPEYTIVEFSDGRRPGVMYDRDAPAHAQVYADIIAKVKAGLLPWLSNLLNEDGTPFLEAPGKPQADSASAVPIDAATDQALASDEGEPFSAGDDIAPLKVVEADLAQTREELVIANERIAELESREPEVRIERVEVEPDPPAAPYVPDFTLIPDALAKFAEADETATDFRNRLKRLWQRFGIADGENFPGGGEPLTGEEKIKMREIDIVLNSDEGKNASLLEWLRADDHNS